MVPFFECNDIFVPPKEVVMLELRFFLGQNLDGLRFQVSHSNSAGWENPKKVVNIVRESYPTWQKHLG